MRVAIAQGERTAPALRMLATESYRMHAKIACAQPGLQFERETTQRKQQCLDLNDSADELQARLVRRRRCIRQRRLGRPPPQEIEFEQPRVRKNGQYAKNGSIT